MTVKRIQRFEVREHLGTGGMGTVYRAYDPQLERDVAIKLLADAHVVGELSPEDTIDLRGNQPTTRDELLREARIMARLSHPNVLPVYEVGLADGAVFVVMEHIDGEDLEAWLATPRSTAAILELVAQAGRGLAAAHASGIVHRDFKPANVLVGSDGRARVADFGLSKLVARSPTAMVQIDDGRGTPRYMAPELFAGQPATTRSDVYAFCSTLDRALGGTHGDEQEGRDTRWRARGLPPRAREVLASGLAADPEARPEMADVLAALETPARRGWPYAVAAGALVVGGVGLAVVLRTAEPSCDIDASRFAAQWNPAKRAALLAALAKLPATPDVTPERVAAWFDDKARSHVDELRATCAADLGKAQRVAREACIERRAIELGALADHIPSHLPRDVDDARESLRDIPDVADCRAIAMRPLPADRAPVAALYARFIASFDLAIPTKAAEHTRVLEELERDARAAGELDLAVRSAYQLAFEYRFQDRLDEADAVAQRSYVDAMQLDDTKRAINAMVFRAKLAAERNHLARARDLANTARSLIVDPDEAVLAMARIGAVLGRAENRAGNHAEAIAHLQAALEYARKAPVRERYVEIEIRFPLIDSLGLAGRTQRAVEVAEETVAYLASALGENDPNYGVALNLLAGAHRANHDLDAAVTARRKALANMRATMPADSSRIMLQRSDLAADLIALGQLEQARDELSAVVAQSRDNQGIEPYRHRALALLGQTRFELGDLDEGQRMLEQAREEAAERLGRGNPVAIAYRQSIVGNHLERQQLDQAEHHLRALADAHREANDPRAELLTRGALAAALANGRGKHADAERLAREALDGLRELAASELQRLLVTQALIESLLGQQRWADARTLAGEALELATKLQWRVDQRAAIEVQLARAEVGLGIRDGYARAERARDVLAKWPGQVAARREVARVLAKRR